MPDTFPAHDRLRTEGDINLSPHRAAFQAQHLGAEARALLPPTRTCSCTRP